MTNHPIADTDTEPDAPPHRPTLHRRPPSRRDHPRRLDKPTAISVGGGPALLRAARAETDDREVREARLEARQVAHRVAHGLQRGGLDVVALEYLPDQPEGSIVRLPYFPVVEALATRDQPVRLIWKQRHVLSLAESEQPLGDTEEETIP